VEHLDRKLEERRGVARQPYTRDTSLMALHLLGVSER
jgi:hypothetical protein